MDYSIMQLAVVRDFVENIGSKSFKEILDNTIHVETQYKDILETFYKVSMVSPNRLTYLDTFPEYGESSRNYRYRFFIVSINDGDYVLVNLKVVDPRNSNGRYFHIYRPISLCGVGSNEDWVIENLKESEFFRYIVVLKDSGDFNEWCNNYYNTIDSCQYMFKSKWKSKHCVNRIRDVLKAEFCDKYVDLEIIDEIIEFSEKWESIRKDKSEKKSDRRLLEMLNKGSGDIRLCVVRLNEKIVAFNIAFIYLDKFVVIHTAKYLSVGSQEYLESEYDVSGDIAKLVHYNLSAYMQYLIHDEYLRNEKYEALYYEGDTKLKWLRRYKQMFYRNIIFYDKVAIEDYDGSLK